MNEFREVVWSKSDAKCWSDQISGYHFQPVVHHHIICSFFFLHNLFLNVSIVLCSVTLASLKQPLSKLPSCGFFFIRLMGKVHSAIFLHTFLRSAVEVYSSLSCLYAIYQLLVKSWSYKNRFHKNLLKWTLFKMYILVFSSCLM